MKLYFIFIFVIAIVLIVAFTVIIIDIGLTIQEEGLKNILLPLWEGVK